MATHAAQAAREEEIDEWCLKIRESLSSEHEERQREIHAVREVCDVQDLAPRGRKGLSWEHEQRQCDFRAVPEARCPDELGDKSERAVVEDFTASTTGLGKQIGNFLVSGRDALPEVLGMHTLIFLNVDGVLNVSLHTPGGRNVLLSDATLELARTPPTGRTSLAQGAHIARMQAVLKRELQHGDDSYADFACSSSDEYSERLVQRLAFIIAAAGPRAEVVLSAAWSFVGVTLLEQAISKYVGRQFIFKRYSPQRSDVGGVGRLRAIGDHMAALQFQGPTGVIQDWRSRRLRVLVLDDFNATGFNGGEMDIDGEKIRNPQDAASYIGRRCAASTFGCVQCAVVHPFDEWTASDQLSVRMGTGLTLECVCKAAQFLGQACPDCSR